MNLPGFPVGPPPSAKLYRQWTIEQMCDYCDSIHQNHYSYASTYHVRGLICATCFEEVIRRIIKLQRMIRIKTTLRNEN